MRKARYKIRAVSGGEEDSESITKGVCFSGRGWGEENRLDLHEVLQSWHSFWEETWKNRANDSNNWYRLGASSRLIHPHNIPYLLRLKGINKTVLQYTAKKEWSQDVMTVCLPCRTQILKSPVTKRRKEARTLNESSLRFLSLIPQRKGKGAQKENTGGEREMRYLDRI